LTEFRFHIKTKEIIKKRVYEFLGIQEIESISQLGYLAIVGGYSNTQKDDKDCLQAIDLKNKLPANDIHQTVVNNIKSLKLWLRSKSELVLDVCGNLFNCSYKNSYLFNLRKAIDMNLVLPLRDVANKISSIKTSKYF
jgi:hypothetical protein